MNKEISELKKTIKVLTERSNDVEKANEELGPALYEAKEEISRLRKTLSSSASAKEHLAWIEGIRNSANTIRSFRATEGVLDQRTLDMAASLLESLASNAEKKEILKK